MNTKKRVYEVHTVMTVYADSEVEAEESAKSGEYTEIKIYEVEDVSRYDEDEEHDRRNDEY